jgi:hypothetical protein
MKMDVKGSTKLNFGSGEVGLLDGEHVYLVHTGKGWIPLTDDEYLIYGIMNL